MAADSLVKRARDEMRKGQLARAVDLANQGVDAWTALAGPTSGAEAHQILAEVALLKGEPAEALHQTEGILDYQMIDRFAMTKALALIALGRTAEARTIVLKKVGTPDRPTRLRASERLYRFPIDDDSSVQALTATAYMLRATCWRNFPEYPETRSDFQAALRLEPSNSTLHLELADSLVLLGAYDEAKAELTKAGTGDDPRFQRELKMVRVTLVYGIEHDPERLKKRTTPEPTLATKP